MINVLIRLEVKDFEALEKFEKQAVAIMIRYRGRLVSAFETARSEDGTGEEVHVLEFPNKEAFALYRDDDSLANLAGLRNQAILSTEVQISLHPKYYVN